MRTSSFNKSFKTGLVLGGAAGAAWLIGKYLTRREVNLIDWSQVRRVALATCRQSIVGLPFSKHTLTAQYAELVHQAETPINDYIGKKLPHPLSSIHVFDRVDWIEANIGAFELLFEPFEKLHEVTMGENSITGKVVGTFNQAVLSGQMGLLLGYLAQRVLGQYDMSLLGREPVTTGHLYFVEPNIRELQHRLALDPREFRMWIVLHETTHAYEFEANPWLRAYMNSLLNRYFETLSSDFTRMGSTSSGGFRTLADRIVANLFSSSNILELMMTTEQRRIFNQLQALMCLLEGYSNHIMQAIGEQLLAGYGQMKERFDQRSKNKSMAERLFSKLTGMDVKMEQYALGERYVNDIVRLRGIGFMNKVWESPLSLPTMDEIRLPAKWVERMERTAAA